MPSASGEELEEEVPDLTAIWIVLLAGGVSAVVTLGLLPRITALPRERWSRAALRPVLVQAAVSSMTAGVVAIVFRAPVEWVLGIALAGGAVSMGRLTLRYTPIRAVKRLTGVLHDESRRASAIAAIGPALDRARPPSTDAVALGSWAQAALIGAAHLVEADEPAAARDVLDRLRGITFKGGSQTNHALLWTHVELYAHDLVAARSALASVQKPIALPLLAAHCEVLEALDLACHGDDVGALARVDAWRYSENWYAKLRLTVRLVAAALRADAGTRAKLEAELTRRFGKRSVAAARALADKHAPVSTPTD